MDPKSLGAHTSAYTSLGANTSTQTSAYKNEHTSLGAHTTAHMSLVAHTSAQTILEYVQFVAMGFYMNIWLVKLSKY